MKTNYEQAEIFVKILRIAPNYKKELSGLILQVQKDAIKAAADQINTVRHTLDEERIMLKCKEAILSLLPTQQQELPQDEGREE